MAYKKLIKVSNVCQLLDKSKFPATTTKAGITWTNNGDGTITANGTATAFTNILVDTVTPTIIKSGHKFLMLGCPLSNGNITTSKEYWMQEGYEFCSDHGVGGFFSLKGNNINLRIYIQKDYTADNLTFKPQIFDLTEMYGAGNEPTTMEQFRQDFPEEMYDYSPYCWLNSYKRVILTGEGNYLTTYQRNLTCNTKNLLPFPYYDTTKTLNGITFTDNGNGTINLSGTSTKQANFYFSYRTLNLKKGVTYTLSASGDYSCSDFFIFYIYNSTYGQVCSIYLTSGNKADSFTPSQDINGINCYLVIPADRTVRGTLKPMLELGSTATDYVPYGHL